MTTPSAEDPPPQPRAVARLGRAFTVDAAREGLFWGRFARGEWEPETLDMLGRLTAPGVQLIDLGAWVGPTALFAAAGGAEVVAVEPDPVALRWLRRNCALNPDLAARIRVFDRVLTPEGGVARFGANRGAGGNSMSSTLHAEMATQWVLPAATPAELADFAGRAARRVVKLDIEGGEYAALPALGPVLACAEAALVSWHPAIARAAGRDTARLAADSAACLRALQGFEAFAHARDGVWRAARTAAPDLVPDGEWLFLRGAAREALREAPARAR